MKTYILPGIKLTAVLLVLLTLIYPAVVWAIAQLAPNGGKGERVGSAGKNYYKNIGQSFTQDRYFWSRPSAVDYNAAGSAGSNKGPSNEAYLAEVQGRIDSILQHNPGVTVSQIPMDLVTASGSGLDPHCSLQAAKLQLSRIANIRKLPEAEVLRLIDKHIEHPLWGIFGPERINVLELNLALDALENR